MKHLGDITKINGAVIETVDCVCGGSPCQDLSVAGKRAGLAGKRSGLYMEQIRIIKEMREADELRGRTGIFIRPRYMVWENVPGAFSSNKGRDFAAVLEEAIRVAEPEAPDVPVPEKGWSKSGCLYDELGGWSVAWRVHDAQFWGAPQRRKRIALVADFGGLSAPEVLFERKGLSGDSEQSGTEREGTAGSSADCPGAASYTVKIRGGCDGGGKGALVQTEKSATLSTLQDQTLITLDKTFCLQGNGIDRADTAGCNGKGWTEDISYTLNTIDRHAVYDGRGNGNGVIVPTITGDHQSGITDYTAICIGNGQANQSIGTVAGALNCMHDQQAVYVPDIAHALHAKANLQFREDSETYIAAVDCRNGTENRDCNGTLQAKSNGGSSYNLQNVCRVGSVVRRLTPRECSRLQGFPDGWTDIGEWVDTKGKRHKAADTPRFKALGNSICTYFWFWLLRRISAQYERPATMGSLFDGIGGFPLCWERCNGKGTARWASEIEEFPIAVTKIRFPESTNVT